MTTYAESFENSVREIINSLLKARGVSLRAASKLTGIPHNTLGEKLNRGRALRLMDLVLMSDALGVSPTYVVAAAEWAVTGVRPVLDEPVDWRAVYELAVRVNSELVFELDTDVPDSGDTGNDTVDDIVSAVPLFSHRDDGYQGPEALPRMA